MRDFVLDDLFAAIPEHGQFLVSTSLRLYPFLPIQLLFDKQNTKSKIKRKKPQKI